jgi:hypothetical protein
MVLPIGVARAGAWRYAFICEIVARHFPHLPEQARAIGHAEARRKLAELYLRSVGAARTPDLMKLFGWKRDDAGRALDTLAAAGLLRRDVRLEGDDDWAVLSELVI